MRKGNGARAILAPVIGGRVIGAAGARQSCRVALASVLALAACGSPAQPAPSSDRRPEPSSSAPPSVLASEVPAAPPESDCARRLRDETPAEVRAVLDDLAYDDVFEDACRVQQAAASHDPSLCEPLAVSSLRDQCRARVAVLTRTPSHCPSARSGGGRDPVCVALALRDRRMCMAAPIVERAVCESSLGGTAHGCGQVPEPMRPDCEARVARLASAVGEVPDGAPGPAWSPTLVLRDAAGELSLESASRGARVSYEHCVPTLSMGDPLAAGSRFGAGGLALSVPLDAEPPFTAQVLLTGAHLDLSTPAHPAAHARDGAITITHLERAFGGAVEGSFHVELDGHVAIDGTFSTFVRDVEDRPADCPESYRPPPIE
jgi:hypothetical protein